MVASTTSEFQTNSNPNEMNMYLPVATENVHNDMPDTDLSKIDFVKLRRFCDQWSEGVHLRQHGAELTSRYTDKEMSQLTLELMRRPDITSLDLSYNNIGDEGVSHLAHCLELGWPLRRLNLMNNCLGDGGAKMLVHAMCHTSRPSRLHTLRLSGNRLGSRGAEHLAHLLARPECQLRDLDVAHTDLTPRGLCHVLASLAQPCCRLQRLVLDRPLLATAGDCDYAADLLNRTLQANTSLQQLSVRHFCLGDQQMHVLLEGLSRHRSLRRLDLSCNQLRVDGARWLAHVLRTNPVLEKVHTCHNHLGTSGAKHLAEALAGRPVITRHLAVRGNSVGCEGLVALLRQMAAGRLGQLWMSGNRAGPATGLVLARMIHTGRTSQDRLDVQPYLVDGSYMVAERQTGDRTAYYNRARQAHECP